MKILTLMLVGLLIGSVVQAQEVQYDLSFERDSWLQYSYSTGLVIRKKKLYDETFTWRAPYLKTIKGELSRVDHLAVMGNSENNFGLYFEQGCFYNVEDFNNPECLLIQVEGSEELQPINNIFTMAGNTPYRDWSIFENRGVSREIKINTELGSGRVLITVDDFLYKDKKIGERFTKLKNDKIRGKVRVSLPSNREKMVSFYKKNDQSGIFHPGFASSISVNSSNFKAVVDANTVGKWQTFWRLPGEADDFIEYSYDGVGIGVENSEWSTIGHISIESKSFDALSSDFSEVDAIEIGDDLKKAVAGFEFSDSEKLDFRNKLIYLVNNKFKMNRLISTLSLKELADLLSNLKAIARNNYLDSVPVSEFSYIGWDIKTAAQVLSVQIAIDSLSSLEMYCKDVDFTLSDGRNKKVSGLLLASFYVSRALTRLHEFKFNEFKFLFQYIDELSKESLTYADVRADSERISRIRDVFNLLKEAGVLKKSPFGIAKEELNYLKENFGDLNGKGVRLSSVISKLQDFEVRADEIRKGTMLKLRSFQPSNTEVVDFKGLAGKVKALEVEISQLSTDMEGLFSVQYSSIEGAVSSGSRKQFIRFIVDIVTSHLSVFNNITGELTIDNFLTSYKAHENIDQKIKVFNSCLPGVE